MLNLSKPLTLKEGIRRDWYSFITLNVKDLKQYILKRHNIIVLANRLSLAVNKSNAKQNIENAKDAHDTDVLPFVGRVPAIQCSVILLSRCIGTVSALRRTAWIDNIAGGTSIKKVLHIVTTGHIGWWSKLQKLLIVADNW